MRWVIRPIGGERSLQEQEPLGKFLKREREGKNITLRELAKKTKVKEHFLKAIEEDRYDLLPSPIYVKGFLSAYAKNVGLDFHEVLLRYEQSFKKVEILPLEVRPPVEHLKKTRINVKHIWIVLSVVAIALLITYFFHPYLSSPPMEPPSKKLERDQIVSSIAPTQVKEVSPGVEGKPFSLDLKALEETWIQIKVNSQLPTEALFKVGERGSYRANDRIELLIGNAGGLDIIFNGKLLERFGRSGEVVKLVFTSQGVERKR